jgi:hypothetical protein
MGEQDGRQTKEAADKGGGDDAGQEQTQNGDVQEQDQTEKPEPDDEAKEKASDMMSAYEDRPTLILPGSRAGVSGTAVGDWLDDDGNPKAMGDEDAPAAKLKSGEGKSSEGKSSEGKPSEGKSADDDEASDNDRVAAEAAEGIGTDEQIEKDKEFNKAILEARERDQGASEEEKAKAERSEKSVTR